MCWCNIQSTARYRPCEDAVGITNATYHLHVFVKQRNTVRHNFRSNQRKVRTQPRRPIPNYQGSQLKLWLLSIFSGCCKLINVLLGCTETSPRKEIHLRWHKSIKDTQKIAHHFYVCSVRTEYEFVLILCYGEPKQSQRTRVRSCQKFWSFV